MGTFSKILTPAIRIGYVILPDELIQPYLEQKKYSDVHTEAFTQYALSEFIESGGLEKHILKMKKGYAKKRQHLIEELSRNSPDAFQIKGHAAGLHLVVCFNSILFTKELINKIMSQKVIIYPIENYVFQRAGSHHHQTEVLLGYAHLTYEEISEGIRRLCDVLRNFR